MTRKLFGIDAVPSMLATGAGPLAALPSRHLRQNQWWLSRPGGGYFVTVSVRLAEVDLP